MASIQIKNISDETYQKLKDRAKADRRSLQQEAAWLLESTLQSGFSPFLKAPLHQTDWAGADRIREGMEQRYGILPDSTSMIREMRDGR